MASQSKEQYTVLPLSLPADAPEILRIHYQVHVSDPLYSTTNTHLPSLPQFIYEKTPSLLARFSSPSLITAKLVLTSHPSKMVSYIVFAPPKADDRSTEEKEQELWDNVKIGKGTNTERVYSILLKEGRMSEQILGKGWEGKWWVLDALVTDEEFQRKGLGSRLVKWGLERIEERKEEGQEGCYLIASPQGSKTYLNAGFERVGSVEIDVPGINEEGGEAYEHVWFVRRF